MTAPKVNRVVNLFGGETTASIGEHLIHDHSLISAVAMVVLYKDGTMSTVATETSSSDLALMLVVFNHEIKDELVG